MKNKAALTNMEAVAPLLDQEGIFHSNHFKLKRKGKVDLTNDYMFIPWALSSESSMSNVSL